MYKTQIIIVASALILLVYVLEQVRRRQLREEYSWLWLIVVVGYCLVSFWPRLSMWLANLMGSANTVSVFGFLGIFFLILISVQYAIRLSRLTTQIKDLGQQVAILDSEVKASRESLAATVDPKEQPTEPIPSRPRQSSVQQVTGGMSKAADAT
jgi:hypothetical protein